jgi:phosphohistidine phosphatase SixA
MVLIKLSRWVVVEHVKFIDERFKNNNYSDEVEVGFQLLKAVFSEWDIDNVGYIGHKPFMIGLRKLKISNRQKNALFKILDIGTYVLRCVPNLCPTTRLKPHPFLKSFI